MKLLVIGVSGMLGNAAFRRLSEAGGIEVHGTARSQGAIRHFDKALGSRILTGVDANDIDSVMHAVSATRPDVIINSVGLIKQLHMANDPLHALPINSLFPHRLARIASVAGARLIHISTDCVFSGSRGNYAESEQPDAYDLYGRSKLLGEVDYPNAITLRTSIIGRELDSNHGLVDWFLSQSGAVKGFTQAIFSGLPTVELADVILNYVIPHPELHGLYHVASAPIDKYQLLRLVATAYEKDIDIEPDDKLVIDRSLDASRFQIATGYRPPTWPELIGKMKQFG